MSTGVRQIDIATIAGVTHSAVSRFENGQSWPRNPDAMIAAYAVETSTWPIDLWTKAIALWGTDGP
jgi:transcriptional regulator with XRE-family HTH domain